MSEYTYRLTETDRYKLDDLTCSAVHMSEHSDRGDIEAVISPELGMSLLGFSLKHIPLLQKSRKYDFINGRKGLGPLIMPSFNQRVHVPVPESGAWEGFSHLDYLKRAGITDPFQHGIGRYASWECETVCDDSKAQVKGHINGQSLLNDTPLEEITGFDFSAFVTYTLQNRTLTITFDLEGRQPVVAGIHFYYALPEEGASQIAMTVDNLGLSDDDSLYEFSEHQKDGKFYVLDLDAGIDTLFSPVSEQKGTARFKLLTPAYRLDTSVLVEGEADEVFEAVVVFHPDGSDFVCVEPLSDKNPLSPSKKEFHGSIDLHPII